MIRLPRLPAALLRTLLDCPTPEDAVHEAVIEATYFQPSLEDLWREHRRALLMAWVEEYPGTRPSLWWRLDAPEPHRAVVAGSGHIGCCPPICGVPFFVDVNRAAPPVLEAEAAFLRRHNLLLSGEARRLRDADYEPEAIEVGDA